MSKTWFDPGTAISGAIALFSAFGTMSQGNYAAAQGEAQSNMFKDAAEQVKVEEGRAHQDLGIQRDRQLSQAKAVLAAQGGGSDDGLISSMAGQYGSQDQRITNDSQQRQRALYYRANYASSQGENARQSSMFKGIGQALGGGYSLFKSGQMKGLY